MRPQLLISETSIIRTINQESPLIQKSIGMKIILALSELPVKVTFIVTRGCLLEKSSHLTRRLHEAFNKYIKKIAL